MSPLICQTGRSTFWWRPIPAYEQANIYVGINYDAVDGSAGITQYVPGNVNFGASEPTTTAAGSQPQLDAVAFVKFFTELTTFDASLVTVAICCAEGLEGSAETEVLSALTDEVIALVWVGKSLLAELAAALALVWILSTCDFRLLTSRLEAELVSSFTEFWRLARSAQ